MIQAVYNIPEDTRKKIVPTPKALVYKEDVVCDLENIEKLLTAGIDEAELQIFFAVMRKMTENIILGENHEKE